MPDTYVLVERTCGSETFLDRDIQAGFFGPSPLVVELAKYRHKCTKPFQIIKPLGARILAGAVCRRYSIRPEDTVVGYWANYILSVAACIGALSGATVEACCHANDVFVRSALGKLAPEKVNAYYFCCRRTLQWATKTYPLPQEKVHFRAHPLPDLPRWESPKDHTLRILNIARNVPKKNLSAVYDTVMALTKHFRRIEFAQIGANRGFRGLAGASNLVIHTLDQVPFRKAVDLMAASHLFLYGSTIANDGDRDGVPNVLREAGAMGLPIVAEKGWANDEVHTHGPILIVPSLHDGIVSIITWTMRLYAELLSAEAWEW